MAGLVRRRILRSSKAGTGRLLLGTEGSRRTGTVKGGAGPWVTSACGEFGGGDVKALCLY